MIYLIISVITAWGVIAAFAKKEKRVYVKPELKVKSTVVPKSFTDDFKDWDQHLYTSNITIIGNTN